MKEVLFALLAGGVGLTLCFAGYRLARIIIPLWGFFAGFTIGAAGVSDALNSGFIGTTMGIFVGLVVGLVFALFSYFFFSLAIVLLSATLGYWLGTSMVLFLGIDKGFLSAAVGIMLGAIAAIVALVINAPKYYLIFVSGIGGAVVTFSGFLLLFGKLELDTFNYAAASAAVTSSWLWAILSIVLAIVGITYQIKMNPDFYLEPWGESEQPKVSK
jgi:Domain of unknown function (DUF4203)